MINKNDFKYIIKKIIIGLAIAFILFNINKCNASALVFKGNQDIATTNTNSRGYLGSNLNWVGTMTFNNRFIPSNYDYDYIGIRFNKLNFTKELQTSFENEELIGTNIESHTLSCVQNNGDFCTEYRYSLSGGQSVPQDYYGNILNGDITISANMYTNSTAVPCWFDNSLGDNMAICPIINTYDYYDHFELVVAYNGFDSVQYTIEYSNVKFFFNNDSTEIVNGLGGVQQQQQQTNDTLTDSNISGANTDTNNALSGINNSVSNTLDSTINANTLNTLLSGFVNQLSNSTCTPITLPIPFTTENITLPCLGTEFSQRIPVLWSLYELIITGVIVLRFWQHAVEFILNILDPYHIGANNIPTGGGK